MAGRRHGARLDHDDLTTYGAQHRALWRCAREQVAALDTMLAALQQARFATPMRRLQTIPGVGSVVAATALAVFAEVRCFPDVKHAASYAGLVPATYQSGDRDGPVDERAEDGFNPLTSSAERRQLTVMSFDLVGANVLAWRFDPEDVRSVVRAVQESASAVIERWEGYVAQYLVDGATQRLVAGTFVIEDAGTDATVSTERDRCNEEREDRRSLAVGDGRRRPHAHSTIWLAGASQHSGPSTRSSRSVTGTGLTARPNCSTLRRTAARPADPAVSRA